MQNIQDILFRYVQAYVRLNEIIMGKAKGDWSKLDILLRNDEEAKESVETMQVSLSEFREATSLGRVFTYPPASKKVYDMMQNIKWDHPQEFRIGTHLEEVRDMLEESFTAGKEDRRVKALYMLAELPNYGPDDWVRRKYLIQGVHLAPEATRIPLYLTRRFEEACFSFIYGNFLAAIALIRATVEIALKERFSIPPKVPLGAVVNDKWLKIDRLRNRDDIREKVKSIQSAGNLIMHQPWDNVGDFFREFATKSFLVDLKSILEFLYEP